MAMTNLMVNPLILDIGFGNGNDKLHREPFDFGYRIWKEHWQASCGTL
jgi:hypothetical protein